MVHAEGENERRQPNKGTLLCRYIARPPIAHDRLERLFEGGEDYGILGQLFPGFSLTSMQIELQPGIPQG